MFNKLLENNCLVQVENYIQDELKEKSESIISILNDTSVKDVEKIFNYVHTYFLEQKIILKSQ